MPKQTKRAHPTHGKATLLTTMQEQIFVAGMTSFPLTTVLVPLVSGQQLKL